MGVDVWGNRRRGGLFFRDTLGLDMGLVLSWGNPPVMAWWHWRADLQCITDVSHGGKRGAMRNPGDLCQRPSGVLKM